MKSWITRILPESLLSAAKRNPLVVLLYRKLWLPRERASNRRRSVKDVFTRIYATNEWGGERGEYYSGTGSSEAHAASYAALVRDFIEEHDIRTVVDLGCGDFTVGREIQTEGVKYIGVDIVEELIERSRRMYADENVSFRCLDIIADELPDADLCLVRQVLQHLSNDQIGAILRKLEKYRYVLISEHYPAPSADVVPNRDKPHGGDVRIFDDSALYLDQPPFDVEISEVVQDVDAGRWLVHPGERIRTFLVEHPEAG